MSPRMSAGEAVIESLRAEGVKYLFGVVGSAFLDILDALYDKTDIQFIGVRHEQAAALMCDGYSRVTGRPSVCIGTNGPGVLNFGLGLAAAYVGHSPVIALAPAVSREHWGRDSFQEFDQVSLFRPITKLSFSIPEPERIPDMLRHAFRVATSGKMGPVLVDIPRDLVSGTTVDMELLPPESYRVGQTRMEGDLALVQKAAQLLLSSQKPVIVAGGGINWSLASQEVTQLAEVLGAGIVAAYGRVDAIPHSHPAYLGHLGRMGAPEATEAVRKADVILAVGTRLAHQTSYYDHRYIQKDTTIIQIEIDPKEIGRNYPVAVGIEGDAKAVTARVLELVRASEKPRNEAWVKEVARLREQRKRRLEEEGKLVTLSLKPQRVYAELRKVIPKDAIVSIDAGLCPAFGQDRVEFHQPRSFLIPLDLGGLGFGFPEAIGAKFAYPQRPVVNFNGDGGFLFNAQELETLVRYRLNVVTVIMNNGSWGSEKAYQKYAFSERYVGADIGNPRFDKFAEVFGARGFYVEHAEDIGDVFLDAVKGDLPAIIEVPVDPNELPPPIRLAEVMRR